MKRIVLLVSLFLGFSGGLAGKLLPIPFEEFRAKAACGVVVQVSAVETFEFSSPPATPWLKDSNRMARANVQTVIGPRDDDVCGSLDRQANFLFSTEVHSAHPETGDRAVVFLTRQDGHLIEAVYGRSYWLLREIDGESYVEITWRNDFLIAPLDVGVTGGKAYVPLSAVRRAWGDTEQAEQ